MKVENNIGWFAAQVPMIHGKLSEPEPSALVIKLTQTPVALPDTTQSSYLKGELTDQTNTQTCYYLQDCLFAHIDYLICI